jgi:hypothetical protein
LELTVRTALVRAMWAATTAEGISCIVHRDRVLASSRACGLYLTKIFILYCSTRINVCLQLKACHDSRTKRSIVQMCCCSQLVLRVSPRSQACLCTSIPSQVLFVILTTDSFRYLPLLTVPRLLYPTGHYVLHNNLTKPRPSPNKEERQRTLLLRRFITCHKDPSIAKNLPCINLTAPRCYGCQSSCYRSAYVSRSVLGLMGSSTRGKLEYQRLTSALYCCVWTTVSAMCVDHFVSACPNPSSFRLNLTPALCSWKRVASLWRRSCCFCTHFRSPAGQPVVLESLIFVVNSCRQSSQARATSSIPGCLWRKSVKTKLLKGNSTRSQRPAILCHCGHSCCFGSSTTGPADIIGIDQVLLPFWNSFYRVVFLSFYVASASKMKRGQCGICSPTYSDDIHPNIDSGCGVFGLTKQQTRRLKNRGERTKIPRQSRCFVRGFRRQTTAVIMVRKDETMQAGRSDPRHLLRAGQ